MELNRTPPGESGGINKVDASTDKAHDTTTSNRLNLHVILFKVSLEDRCSASRREASEKWGSRGYLSLHKGDNPSLSSIPTQMVIPVGTAIPSVIPAT